jgi:Flp pilus assembly protein TadG
MNRERGQALVEVVVALPVCIACAVTMVDCGVVIRDRIAIAQAADRAAEASLRGSDTGDAARGALPSSVTGVDVDVTDGRVTVRATSHVAIAGLVGRRVVQRSTVELAEVAR